MDLHQHATLQHQILVWLFEAIHDCVNVSRLTIRVGWGGVGCDASPLVIYTIPVDLQVEVVVVNVAAVEVACVTA